MFDFRELLLYIPKQPPAMHKNSRHSCLFIKIQTSAPNAESKNIIGDAGYRSRYLSHAKRALFHLSYTPVLANCGQSPAVVESWRA
jgi:hypothetical protein